MFQDQGVQNEIVGTMKKTMEQEKIVVGRELGRNKGKSSLILLTLPPCSFLPFFLCFPFQTI